MSRKLSAVLIAAVLSMSCLAACSGNKAVVNDLSKVTLEDIAKANEGNALLEEHSSIQYRMEMHNDGIVTEWAGLSKEGDDYVYYVKLEDSASYQTEVYKDGYVYSEYGGEDGLEYGVYWFMDGEYDRELNDSVSHFLVNGTDGLEISKVEEEEGFVSVTAQLDESGGGSEAAHGTFYEYVMDKDTLDINQFVAYSLDSEDKQSIYSFAQVTYDEELEEQSFVQKLQGDESKRQITVVVDPGETSEKTYDIEISSKAVFDAVVAEGYGVYTDKNGTNAYNPDQETPLGEEGYGSRTVYVIKDGISE